MHNNLSLKSVKKLKLQKVPPFVYHNINVAFEDDFCVCVCVGVGGWGGGGGGVRVLNDDANQCLNLN